jgi:hypothetical protein
MDLDAIRRNLEILNYWAEDEFKDDISKAIAVRALARILHEIVEPSDERN